MTVIALFYKVDISYLLAQPLLQHSPRIIAYSGIFSIVDGSYTLQGIACLSIAVSKGSLYTAKWGNNS